MRIADELAHKLGLPERKVPAHSDSGKVKALIQGILSQNTSDHNRDIAMRRFEDAYDNFEEVIERGVEYLESVIRPAGLAPQRAERIIALLRWLDEELGEFDVNFLCKMSTDEAMTTLTNLKGIGIKTAAVFLLFICEKEVFPVDTHIRRILQRLGLFKSTYSASRIQEEVAGYIPDQRAYSFHLNLIRHGREVCDARNPKCNSCVLADDCSSAGEFNYDIR